MSKLLKLKEWLTLDEAAKHISSAVGERATAADLYRFALDGHLILSVNFVNEAYARKGSFVKSEDVEFVEITAENSPFLYEFCSDLSNKFAKNEADKKELLTRPANAEIKISSDYWISLEEEVKSIEGIWDLSMIGSEVLDIEHFYQQLTSGLEVTLINIDGTFVQNGETICQLQTDFDDNEFQPFSLAQKRDLENHIKTSDMSDEEAKQLKTQFDEGRAKYLSERAPGLHSSNFFPSGGLAAHDYVLVIRTNELERFLQLLEEPKNNTDTTTNSLAKKLSNPFHELVAHTYFTLKSKHMIVKARTVWNALKEFDTQNVLVKINSKELVYKSLYHDNQREVAWSSFSSILTKIKKINK